MGGHIHVNDQKWLKRVTLNIHGLRIWRNFNWSMDFGDVSWEVDRVMD